MRAICDRRRVEIVLWKLKHNVLEVAMQTHNEKDLTLSHEHFNLPPREDQLEDIDPKLRESQSVIGEDDNLMNIPGIADVIPNFPTCAAAVDGSLLEDDLLAYLYPMNNPFEQRYFSNQNNELLISQEQGPPKHAVLEQRIIEDEQQENHVSCRILSLKEEATGVSSGSIRSSNSRSNLKPETVKESQTGAQVSQNPQNIHCKNSNASITFWSSSFSGISSPLNTNTTSILPPGCHPPSRSIVDAATSRTKVGCPMNFLHFSRPAALAKAALQTISIHNNLDSYPPIVEEQMGASVTGIISTSGVLTPCHASPKLNSQCSFISSKETFNLEENTALNMHKKVKVDDGWQSMPLGDAAQVDHSESESAVGIEPTITTSSGGSGIGSESQQERGYRNGKFKLRADLPDCQSEDVENKPPEQKKSAPKATKRRNRAAEVHNLAERRRRDRINEKMKALQELIPNCSKTDKASILDEAIEYVKTLQLHLQMMSVRAGFTFTPVIVPTAPKYTATNEGICTVAQSEIIRHLVDVQIPRSGIPLLPAIPNSSNVPMPSAMGAESQGLDSFGLREANGDNVSPSQLSVQDITPGVRQTYLLHQH